jgi:hypothetical protein
VLLKFYFTIFNFQLTSSLIMKTAGIILTILGAIGTIMFGLQAMQDSESFSILGVDVAVSSANWAPVIISVILLVVGLVMAASGRK